MKQLPPSKQTRNHDAFGCVYTDKANIFLRIPSDLAALSCDVWGNVRDALDHLA
jgi:hypothetical protein